MDRDYGMKDGGRKEIRGKPFRPGVWGRYQLFKSYVGGARETGRSRLKNEAAGRARSSGRAQRPFVACDGNLGRAWLTSCVAGGRLSPSTLAAGPPLGARPLPEWNLPVRVGVAPVVPPIPHQQRSATPKPGACKRKAAVPGASRLQAPRGGPRWSGEGGPPSFSSIHSPTPSSALGARRREFGPARDSLARIWRSVSRCSETPPTTDNVSFGSEPEPQRSDD